MPDRCGEPRLLETVSAAPGEAVPVPTPGPDEVVFVRIGGAEVSGLEKLTTVLVHPGSRHLVVNGAVSYRLIPETAGDGLLMRAGPGVVAGAGPFAELRSPKCRRWPSKDRRPQLRILRRAGQPRPRTAVIARLTPSLAPIPA